MRSNLNELLNFYNLSQKDLIDGTGINKNTISRYCSNTFEKIDKNHIDLLCSFFMCTPNDIFVADNNLEITYPSEMVKNMIESYKVMQKLSQEEIESIVTDTSDSQMNSYIKNSPKIITSHDVIKNAKEFENKNGYNPIMTDDEIYELDRIQERLDKEYDINDNLEKIVNYILDNSDLSNLKSKIKTELNALKAVDNAIPFIFRFMLAFHSLYYIVMKQMYDKQLVDFLQEIKRVYVNHNGTLMLNDKEIDTLLNHSKNVLQILKID